MLYLLAKAGDVPFVRSLDGVSSSGVLLPLEC